LLFMFVFSSCGGEKTSGVNITVAVPSLQRTGSAAASLPAGLPAETASFLRSLDELAELERAGLWYQGMGLAESGLRESAGDLAGAVAAAYKEISRTYAFGLIQKIDVENGILHLLAVQNDETVIAASNAIIAFLNDRWTEAADGFSPLFDELEEPDSFIRWMTLVCSLEKSKAALAENRRAAAAYRSIRARYVTFPEYWYRGARVFSGAVAADYAENCINLSPNGPFAGECRKIIASYTGLKTEDGSSIKTKKEIETIISQSVNAANPQILDDLLPLIGLPENPYTVYAVGALRALTAIPGFRDYFSSKAAAASGRLAERLLYICRG